MEPSHNEQKNNPIETISSRYARQLNAGFPFLKFSPDIEKEFRKSYIRLILLRSRIAFITACILIVTFEIMDRMLVPGAPVFWTSIIRFVVIAPALLAAGLSTFSRHLRPYLLKLISIASLVSGLGIVSIFLINYHAVSHVRYESLILMTAVVYFVPGLLFRMTTGISIIVMLAYVVTSIATGVDHTLILSSCLFLMLMNIIGIAGCYVIELAIRSNYLQKKILLYLAEHDGLTGIYNRHTFNESYNRLWRQAVRDRKAMAVLMLDIDYFKNYNDINGHLEGDVALKKIAAALDRYMRRPLDIAARYGGEEFIIIWYDADERQAREMAEQCRISVESLAIPHKKSRISGVITISAGCAILVPSLKEGPEELIQRADDALYRAKRQGRNRVVFAQARSK